MERSPISTGVIPRNEPTLTPSANPTCTNRMACLLTVLRGERAPNGSRSEAYGLVVNATLGSCDPSERACRSGAKGLLEGCGARRAIRMGGDQAVASSGRGSLERWCACVFVQATRWRSKPIAPMLSRASTSRSHPRSPRSSASGCGFGGLNGSHGRPGCRGVRPGATLSQGSRPTMTLVSHIPLSNGCYS